ncbi:MAG: polysaccharide export protein [Candidatus Aminicenantes bacterium]|nr:polysaccharide export protein [Candidatus Aminicenantes bacterium]
MKHQTAIITGAILFLWWGSSVVPAQDVAEQTERFVTAYRIGPKDLLGIEVREDAKLNTEVRVSEQGKINLAYINEIYVEGLTAAELGNKLAELYSPYLRDPHVAVTIKERQSKQVSILGAVTKPGFVQLFGRTTLLEAITAAGGLTREAAREIIIIRTFPDGTTNNIKIPIDDLMLRGDPKYNLPLEAGDSVIVQIDRTVIIYIYGQVKSPGALAVLQSRIPTVTQAIAQAGGFTDRAAKRRVVVTRKDENGREKTFNINVVRIQNNRIEDFQLREGDTVFVPDTIF